jgi:hypothetical protein
MERPKSGEQETAGKGVRMNDRRKSEVVRREEAQAHAGEEIVAGSGKRGKPRRMAQMVSVRLDGELIGKLRIVAEERNATLSDLLREGAELIVDDAYASARPRTSFTISGAQEALHETMSGRALAAH